MKTIGFIDYYISEWHANNYPVWIKEYCEKSGKDFQVKYVWAEKEVSLVDGKTTDEWCKEFGVEKCFSIEELCEKSDYLVILAPSNPEKHLKYAKIALKYSKNIYIDKTFAPDYDTAKEIFDIAKEHNTKFFSTSALRFATELDEIKNCKSLVLTGGGASFEEYIIHQVEIAVKVMGIGATRVKTENQARSNICRIDYGNEKYVTLNYAGAMPLSIASCDINNECKYKQFESDYFKRLIESIINFFETGNVCFDTKETLEVMKIREKLILGNMKENQWMEI